MAYVNIIAMKERAIKERLDKGQGVSRVEIDATPMVKLIRRWAEEQEDQDKEIILLPENHIQSLTPRIILSELKNETPFIRAWIASLVETILDAKIEGVLETAKRDTCLKDNLRKK